MCGKIRAYQVGHPESFSEIGHGSSHRSNDINTNYLDGVSLTHGTPDNTSGPSLQLSMKSLTPQRTVLALAGVKQVQPLDLQLSWGTTTSVIRDLVVALIYKPSTAMTLYGMVLVVGL